MQPGLIKGFKCVRTWWVDVYKSASKCTKRNLNSVANAAPAAIGNTCNLSRNGGRVSLKKPTTKSALGSTTGSAFKANVPGGRSPSSPAPVHASGKPLKNESKPKTVPPPTA